MRAFLVFVARAGFFLLASRFLFFFLSAAVFRLAATHKDADQHIARTHLRGHTTRRTSLFILIVSPPSTMFAELGVKQMLTQGLARSNHIDLARENQPWHIQIAH